MNLPSKDCHKFQALAVNQMNLLGIGYMLSLLIGDINSDTLAPLLRRKGFVRGLVEVGGASERVFLAGENPRVLTRAARIAGRFIERERNDGVKSPAKTLNWICCRWLVFSLFRARGVRGKTRATTERAWTLPK